MNRIRLTKEYLQKLDVAAARAHAKAALTPPTPAPERDPAWAEERTGVRLKVDEARAREEKRLKAAAAQDHGEVPPGLTCSARLA